MVFRKKKYIHYKKEEVLSEEDPKQLSVIGPIFLYRRLGRRKWYNWKLKKLKKPPMTHRKYYLERYFKLYKETYKKLHLKRVFVKIVSKAIFSIVLFRQLKVVLWKLLLLLRRINKACNVKLFKVFLKILRVQFLNTVFLKNVLNYSTVMNKNYFIDVTGIDDVEDDRIVRMSLLNQNGSSLNLVGGKRIGKYQLYARKVWKFFFKFNYRKKRIHNKSLRNCRKATASFYILNKSKRWVKRLKGFRLRAKRGWWIYNKCSKLFFRNYYFNKKQKRYLRSDYFWYSNKRLRNAIQDDRLILKQLFHQQVSCGKVLRLKRWDTRKLYLRWFLKWKFFVSEKKRFVKQNTFLSDGSKKFRVIYQNFGAFYRALLIKNKHKAALRQAKIWARHIRKTKSVRMVKHQRWLFHRAGYSQIHYNFKEEKRLFKGRQRLSGGGGHKYFKKQKKNLKKFVDSKITEIATKNRNTQVHGYWYKKKFYPFSPEKTQIQMSQRSSLKRQGCVSVPQNEVNLAKKNEVQIKTIKSQRCMYLKKKKTLLFKQNKRTSPQRRLVYNNNKERCILNDLKIVQQNQLFWEKSFLRYFSSLLTKKQRVGKLKKQGWNLCWRKFGVSCIKKNKQVMFKKVRCKRYVPEKQRSMQKQVDFSVHRCKNNMLLKRRLAHSIPNTCGLFSALKRFYLFKTLSLKKKIDGLTMVTLPFGWVNMVQGYVKDVWMHVYGSKKKKSKMHLWNIHAKKRCKKLIALIQFWKSQQLVNNYSQKIGSSESCNGVRYNKLLNGVKNKCNDAKILKKKIKQFRLRSLKSIFGFFLLPYNKVFYKNGFKNMQFRLIKTFSKTLYEKLFKCPSTVGLANAQFNFKSCIARKKKNIFTWTEKIKSLNIGISRKNYNEKYRNLQHDWLALAEWKKIYTRYLQKSRQKSYRRFLSFFFALKFNLFNKQIIYKFSIVDNNWLYKKLHLGMRPFKLDSFLLKRLFCKLKGSFKPNNKKYIVYQNFMAARFQIIIGFLKLKKKLFEKLELAWKFQKMFTKMLFLKAKLKFYLQKYKFMGVTPLICDLSRYKKYNCFEVRSNCFDWNYRNNYLAGELDKTFFKRFGKYVDCYSHTEQKERERKEDAGEEEEEEEEEEIEPVPFNVSGVCCVSVDNKVKWTFGPTKCWSTHEYLCRKKNDIQENLEIIDKELAERLDEEDENEMVLLTYNRTRDYVFDKSFEKNFLEDNNVLLLWETQNLYFDDEIEDESDEDLVFKVDWD